MGKKSDVKKGKVAKKPLREVAKKPLREVAKKPLRICFLKSDGKKGKVAKKPLRVAKKPALRIMGKNCDGLMQSPRPRSKKPSRSPEERGKSNNSTLGTHCSIRLFLASPCDPKSGDDSGLVITCLWGSWTPNRKRLGRLYCPQYRAMHESPYRSSSLRRRIQKRIKQSKEEMDAKDKQITKSNEEMDAKDKQIADLNEKVDNLEEEQLFNEHSKQMDEERRKDASSRNELYIENLLATIKNFARRIEHLGGRTMDIEYLRNQEETNRRGPCR